MKKIFCIFICLSTYFTVFSQNKFINAQIIQNKEELIGDSTLKHFSDRAGLDIGNYNIIKLYDFIDTIADYRSKNKKFKIKKYHIEYYTHNEFELFYSEKTVNDRSKKQNNNKILCCFKTSEKNDDNKYKIIFFIIDP